jgi:transposase-like protein
MSKEKSGKNYTTQLSESFVKTDGQCTYEPAFRRWLVREIEEQKITIPQAIERFNINPGYGYELIRNWRLKYAPGLVLSLPDMTAAEKQQLATLQQQLATSEKQLEDAKMKNIALNMLIDVAEEKLKISIRKKPGAKQ